MDTIENFDYMNQSSKQKEFKICTFIFLHT